MGKRAVISIVTAVALAIVLAVIGYLFGLDLATLRMERAGITHVVVNSPGEGRGVSLMTALQFAWPAIAAGIAIAIERWRSGNDPPVLVAILYFAIPAVLVAGYVALSLSWYASMVNTGGVAPIVSLRDLGPTVRDAQLLGFVSLVMWLYVWVRRG